MTRVYIGSSAMIQGIQGKTIFDCTTYGSRVKGQNVKWPVIAPPRGKLEKSGAEFGLAKTENPIYLIKTYTKFLIL